MNLRTISAIIFFLLIGILLVLTYYPDLPDVKVRIRGEWFRLDYIGHLGFYAAIASTFLVWQTGWRKKIPIKLIILTFIAGIVLGIFTEYSQKFILGRSFNPMDMLYNCVGIVAGVLFSWAVGQKVDGGEGKTGRRGEV